MFGVNNTGWYQFAKLVEQIGSSRDDQLQNMVEEKWLGMDINGYKKLNQFIKLLLDFGEKEMGSDPSSQLRSFFTSSDMTLSVSTISKQMDQIVSLLPDAIQRDKLLKQIPILWDNANYRDIFVFNNEKNGPAKPTKIIEDANYALIRDCPLYKMTHAIFPLNRYVGYGYACQKLASKYVNFFTEDPISHQDTKFNPEESIARLQSAIDGVLHKTNLVQWQEAARHVASADPGYRKNKIPSHQMTTIFLRDLGIDCPDSVNFRPKNSELQNDWMNEYHNISDPPEVIAQ